MPHVSAVRVHAGMPGGGLPGLCHAAPGPRSGRRSGRRDGQAAGQVGYRSRFRIRHPQPCWRLLEPCEASLALGHVSAACSAALRCASAIGKHKSMCCWLLCVYGGGAADDAGFALACCPRSPSYASAGRLTQLQGHAVPLVGVPRDKTTLCAFSGSLTQDWMYAGMTVCLPRSSGGGRSLMAQGPGLGLKCSKTR